MAADVGAPWLAPEVVVASRTRLAEEHPAHAADLPACRVPSRDMDHEVAVARLEGAYPARFGGKGHLRPDRVRARLEPVVGLVIRAVAVIRAAAPADHVNLRARAADAQLKPPGVLAGGLAALADELGQLHPQPVRVAPRAEAVGVLAERLIVAERIPRLVDAQFLAGDDLVLVAHGHGEIGPAALVEARAAVLGGHPEVLGLRDRLDRNRLIGLVLRAVAGTAPAAPDGDRRALLHVEHELRVDPLVVRHLPGPGRRAGGLRRERARQHSRGGHGQHGRGREAQPPG